MIRYFCKNKILSLADFAALLSKLVLSKVIVVVVSMCRAEERTCGSAVLLGPGQMTADELWACLLFWLRQCPQSFGHSSSLLSLPLPFTRFRSPQLALLWSNVALP